MGGVAHQAPAMRAALGIPAGASGERRARCLRAFVAELVAAGVRDAVVCPGSRSTPLALALRAHPGSARARPARRARRGLLRAGHGPDRVAGRSSCWARPAPRRSNFAPAVVEASLRARAADRAHRRPARRAARPGRAADDRPGPPLRAHAKWFAELPLPDGDPATRRARAVRWRVARSRRRCAGPAGSGASQLAVPRAAAAGRPAGASERRSAAPFATGSTAGARSTTPRSIARGAARRRGAGAHRRGSGRRLGPPRGARGARGQRRLSDPRGPALRPQDGRHDRSLVVARADQLVRQRRLDRGPSPELVIRTRRHAHLQADRDCWHATTPELIVLDGDRDGASPRWFPRPSSTPIRAQTARGDRRQVPRRAGDSAWAAGLAPRRPRRGRGDGRAAGRARRAVRRRVVPGARGRPAGRVHAVRRQLHAGPRHGRSGCRRRSARSRCARTAARTGSTASCRRRSGRPRSPPAPVVLVVGDLSFLHDLNALVAAKLHDLSATIVLVNNDGGGIFSFLPQASPPSPGPASRTGTRSCSGRRTGSTSRRS